MEEAVHSVCLAHYHFIIKLLQPHALQIAILINFPKKLLLLSALVAIPLARLALVHPVQNALHVRGLCIIIHLLSSVLLAVLLTHTNKSPTIPVHSVIKPAQLVLERVA